MGARASFPMVSLTKDRIIVVTGANTGIGYEIAKHCAIMGATVILACRSEDRARSAMERIQQEYESEVITAHDGENNQLAIEFMQVDLASFKSVVNFCDEFKKTGRQLHVLFCNAGLGMVPYSVTEDGFELILQANYLGHFLMIAQLLDVMKRSGPDCRILLTSSGAHKWARIDIATMNYTGSESGYSKWNYYGRSKAYQIIQTLVMARRLKGSNISINSFHPGIVATDFTRFVTNPCHKVLLKCGHQFVRTPIQGATCGIDLAVNPKHSGVSGHYWIDCRIAEPSSYVRDEETQNAVWQETFKFLKDYLNEDEINTMEKKVKIE